MYVPTSRSASSNVRGSDSGPPPVERGYLDNPGGPGRFCITPGPAQPGTFTKTYDATLVPVTPPR